MSKKLLVAILTSNNSFLAEKCLLSVLNQNPFDSRLEVHVVVVVNSLIPTYADTIRRALQKHGVLIIETQSDGSPGKGKKSVYQLLANSDFDYVSQCDGDDMLFPNAIAELCKIIFHHNPSIVVLQGCDKLISVHETRGEVKATRAKNGSYEIDADFFRKHIKVISSDDPTDPNYRAQFAPPIDLFSEQNIKDDHTEKFESISFCAPGQCILFSKDIVKKYSCELYDQQMQLLEDLDPILICLQELHEAQQLNDPQSSTVQLPVFWQSSHWMLYNKTNLSSMSNAVYSADGILTKQRGSVEQLSNKGVLENMGGHDGFSDRRIFYKKHLSEWRYRYHKEICKIQPVWYPTTTEALSQKLDFIHKFVTPAVCTYLTQQGVSTLEPHNE